MFDDETYERLDLNGTVIEAEGGAQLMLVYQGDGTPVILTPLMARKLVSFVLEWLETAPTIDEFALDENGITKSSAD